VEAALKIARKATGRTRIVCTKNGFHGKSYGALSVTGQEKYQLPFAPLVPNVTCVEFGNVDSLREELRRRDVAAFIVEPIQGEGGVIVPPDTYLQKVAHICQETGTLLILDEIQTGFGRTGSMFRFQALGVQPDILCLAKALGGSIAAIGATMTTDVVWHKAYGEKMDSTLHTSTFGGGSLACIVAIATIKAIQADQLAKQAAENGAWLKQELLTLQKTYSALIQEVRGEGLMIGIEFRKQKKTLGTAIFAAVTKAMEKVDEGEAIAALIARELLLRGVVTAFTLNRENVIRIAPPLIATREDLQILLNALENVLSNFNSLWQLNGGLRGAIQAVMPKK
jgi:putrescine aminotransferase